MLGVDAETHGQIDGFVEFGILGFLEERNCVRKDIRAGLNERAGLRQIFGDLSHSSLVSHRTNLAALFIAELTRNCLLINCWLDEPFGRGSDLA